MGYWSSSVKLFWLCSSSRTCIDPFRILSHLFFHSFKAWILELKSAVKHTLFKLSIYHHPSYAYCRIFWLFLDRTHRTLWRLQPFMVPSHWDIIWISSVWIVCFIRNWMVAIVFQVVLKNHYKRVFRSFFLLNLRSKLIFLVKYALFDNSICFINWSYFPYQKIFKRLWAKSLTYSLDIPPSFNFSILDLHKSANFLKHGRTNPWESNIHALPTQFNLHVQPEHLICPSKLIICPCDCNPYSIFLKMNFKITFRNVYLQRHEWNLYQLARLRRSILQERTAFSNY